MEIINERQQIVIKILLEHDGYITSAQLSNELHVSVRTIKSTLKDLKELLENYGCEIIIKHGAGYTIRVKNDLLFKPIDNQLHQLIKKPLPQSQRERSTYIVRKMLLVDYPIKLDDLGEELFVSRNTITLDMKEVKRLLMNYHLQIVHSSNCGIMVEGNEIQKRRCINDFFFQDEKQNFFAQNNLMFSSENNQKEIRFIREALLHVLNEYAIRFSDLSIQNMVIHIIILLRRCRFYQYVQVDKDNRFALMKDQAYQAALQLASSIEDYLHIVLPEDEILYLTMHIQSKAILGSEDMKKKDFRDVDQTLMRALQRIEKRFHISFYQDQEIYHFLRLHLPPMIERIRNQLTMRNPLLQEHIRRYQAAVEICLEAVDEIEDSYQMKVDEDEFAYLVLYFNLALSRYRNRIKKRLLLVSGYGRPEMIVTLNTLNDNFKGLIEDIITCDTYELENFAYQSNDVIITTIPLTIAVDIPVVYIQNQIECYYKEILSILKSEHHISFDMKKYLKSSLFEADVTSKSTEEVMAMMKGLIKKEFGSDETDQVVDHIHDLGCEVGNETVFLHSMYDCKSPFISCILLKNPILWKKQYVKYVFLLNMNGEQDQDLVHYTYSVLSQWCDLKDQIYQRDYDHSYEMLITHLHDSKQRL